MSAARELMPIAIEAVDLAAATLRSRRPVSVTSKGDRDMASDLDHHIERQVRDHLAEKAPAVGFLGEEHGRSGSQESYWVLDPIDGTANFIKGIPLCAVSLALIEDGNPVLGIVDAPLLGTRYTAIRGAGSHEGTRRLKASDTSDLRSAIVAIGDYSVGPDSSAKNAVRLAITQLLAERAQRVRMLGSVALDLAWVADGRLDASITMSNHTWDMAAGTLIAREADAQILDRDGSTYALNSTATIAVAPGLLAEIVGILDEVATPAGGIRLGDGLVDPPTAATGR